jgi:hypothetical protein
MRRARATGPSRPRNTRLGKNGSCRIQDRGFCRIIETSAFVFRTIMVRRQEGPNIHQLRFAA